MDTDTRSHGILVNAAGLLYASLGFSLSVLAALFSVFHRTNAQNVPTIPLHTRPHLPSGSRGRHLVRSVSDKSPKASKLPPASSPAKPKETSSEKQRTRPHSLRRSKSMIPIITIDYFGSTDSLRSGRTSADFTAKIEPQVAVPQPFVVPVPPTPETASSSASTSSAASCSSNERPGFRLFGLKSWGKDKPLQRRQSSPQLCQASSLSLCTHHKQTSSDGMLTIPVKSESKPKTRKMLRKMTSVPVHEKFGIISDASLPRTVEKKRSLPLRTQPYDAPYFAPPPVPPLPVAYRSPPRREAVPQSDLETSKSPPSKPQILKS
ncbi:hypothetical protein GALMADRAFT_218765 [Galerina marginata CBS 339.88]|uniref:Uncharacterized protein n=1 Tax=Galerina marginata (strain CBS 339.88) TaxID=685588 RepID=A0A067U2P2_GALM3|nr:hypothetical protein GALMADRAFT_218765 [Galerina marginata CBS 339.88]